MDVKGDGSLHNAINRLRAENERLRRALTDVMDRDTEAELQRLRRALLGEDEEVVKALCPRCCRDKRCDWDHNHHKVLLQTIARALGMEVPGEAHR